MFFHCYRSRWNLYWMLKRFILSAFPTKYWDNVNNYPSIKRWSSFQQLKKGRSFTVDFNVSCEFATSSACNVFFYDHHCNEILRNDLRGFWRKCFGTLNLIQVSRAASLMDLSNQSNDNLYQYNYSPQSHPGLCQNIFLTQYSDYTELATHLLLQLKLYVCTFPECGTDSLRVENILENGKARTILLSFLYLYSGIFMFISFLVVFCESSKLLSVLNAFLSRKPVKCHSLRLI